MTLQYDPDLKQRAIERAISGQKPVAQVARDLEIKTNTLCTWVDQFKRANPNTFPKQESSKPINLETETDVFCKNLPKLRRTSNF